MNIYTITTNEWIEIDKFPRKTSEHDRFIFRDSDCRYYIGGSDILSSRDVVAWMPAK